MHGFRNVQENLDIEFFYFDKKMRKLVIDHRKTKRHSPAIENLIRFDLKQVSITNQADF